MAIDGERKIYLHIGLHKTGSTYLQMEVFPLLGMSSLNALVGRRIDDFGLVVSGNKLLISEENLSACPYSGTPPEALDKPWLERSCNAIRNLAVLFPDAHVILGIRHHESWLMSLYKQYLHQGGMKKINAFFDISTRDQGVLKQSDLCMRPRIELLSELFCNRVFVYNSADLNRNRLSMVEAICGFLGEGLPPRVSGSTARVSNKGVGHYQAGLLRVLNHVDRVRRIRKTWTCSRVLCQKVLAGWPSRPLELPADVGKYVNDYYIDDWNYALKYCHQSGEDPTISIDS